MLFLPLDFILPANQSQTCLLRLTAISASSWGLQSSVCSIFSRAFWLLEAELSSAVGALEEPQGQPWPWCLAAGFLPSPCAASFLWPAWPHLQPGCELFLVKTELLVAGHGAGALCGDVGLCVGFAIAARLD